MNRRLFLERRTYRRNRLQDAARLAPELDVQGMMEMVPKLAEVRAVLDRDRD